MSLRIEQLFGYAAVQGAPGYGRARFGVPVGGAFDMESLALANSLVGNSPSTPGLELAMASARLRTLEETTIALAGGHSTGRNNESFVVRAQQIVELEPPRTGARIYLAAPGGVGLHGADIVFGSPSHLHPVRLADQPASLAPRPLRIIETPRLSVAETSLTTRVFQVSHRSNRAGVRLEPNAKSHRLELPSEPSCPGAIQLTPGGELIIIGPDGPTIGGYPTVAVVCQADLDRVGQLRAGQEVSFEVIDLEQAGELRRQRETRLAKLLTGLRLSSRQR